MNKYIRDDIKSERIQQAIEQKRITYGKAYGLPWAIVLNCLPDSEKQKIQHMPESMRGQLKHILSDWYCGYVAVPLSHPAYGMDLWDCDFDVHGGITFARAGGTTFKDQWWVLGYDCNHSFSDDIKLNYEYQLEQIKSLAQQLRAMRYHKPFRR